MKREIKHSIFSLNASYTLMYVATSVSGNMREGEIPGTSSGWKAVCLCHSLLGDGVLLMHGMQQASFAGATRKLESLKRDEKLP